MQANTVWDEKPWMSTSDRIAWQRSLVSDNYQQRMIANALLNADPSLSDAELRLPGQNTNVPPRYGYTQSEINVMDVLTGVPNRAAIRPALNDFSGSPAGYAGSSRNSFSNQN